MLICLFIQFTNIFHIGWPCIIFVKVLTVCVGLFVSNSSFIDLAAFSVLWFFRITVHVSIIERGCDNFYDELPYLHLLPVLLIPKIHNIIHIACSFFYVSADLTPLVLNVMNFHFHVAIIVQAVYFILWRIRIIEQYCLIYIYIFILAELVEMIFVSFYICC